MQEFLGKLVATLAQFPPPQPSRPAVDLLVTVGQQQEYLAWHNLLPSRGEQGALDALQVGSCALMAHLICMGGLQVRWESFNLFSSRAP